MKKFINFLNFSSTIGSGLLSVAASIIAIPLIEKSFCQLWHYILFFLGLILLFIFLTVVIAFLANLIEKKKTSNTIEYDYSNYYKNLVESADSLYLVIKEINEYNRISGSSNNSDPTIKFLKQKASCLCENIAVFCDKFIDYEKRKESKGKKIYNLENDKKYVVAIQEYLQNIKATFNI